jgi:hypothetical protein
MLQLGHFLFLVFINMAASDLNELLAGLLLLPEYITAATTFFAPPPAPSRRPPARE